MELPPRQEVGFPASAYAFIRQFAWVLAGTLEFQEGEQSFRLPLPGCDSAALTLTV